MPKLIDILEKNNYELTKEDIEKNKSDIGSVIYFNKTVLTLYLEYNKNPNLEIIKLLRYERDIYFYKKTPLICYFLNNNIENINPENINPEIIKYFSNQIGKEDSGGKTALVYYLECNEKSSIEIIKLLEKEKDIFNKYNKTHLMYYLQRNKNPSIEVINYFENQIGKKYKYGYTALMYYLEYNNNPSIEIIKLLEKEKDIIDTDNNTSLMLYCMNSDIENLDPEIINYFSNQINHIKNEKHNILHIYLEYNSNPKLKIIKLLEKNIKEKFNNYLIHYYYNELIENLNPKIIKHFEKEIGLKDKDNETTLTLYLSNNNSDCIDSEYIKYLYKEIGYIDFKSYDNIYLDVY